MPHLLRTVPGMRRPKTKSALVKAQQNDLELNQHVDSQSVSALATYNLDHPVAQQEVRKHSGVCYRTRCGGQFQAHRCERSEYCRTNPTCGQIYGQRDNETSCHCLVNRGAQMKITLDRVILRCAPRNDNGHACTNVATSRSAIGASHRSMSDNHVA
eukprot:SAG11_NODE_1101_length_5868_cov_2.045935_9_plen_157_part_00